MCSCRRHRFWVSHAVPNGAHWGVDWCHVNICSRLIFERKRASSAVVFHLRSCVNLKSCLVRGRVLCAVLSCAQSCLVRRVLSCVRSLVFVSRFLSLCAESCLGVRRSCLYLELVFVCGVVSFAWGLVFYSWFGTVCGVLSCVQSLVLCVQSCLFCGVLPCARDLALHAESCLVCGVSLVCGL